MFPPINYRDRRVVSSVLVHPAHTGDVRTEGNKSTAQRGVIARLGEHQGTADVHRNGPEVRQTRLGGAAPFTQPCQCGSELHTDRQENNRSSLGCSRAVRYSV